MRKYITKDSASNLFVTSFSRHRFSLRKFYAFYAVDESRKHCDVIYNRWFWNTRCCILFYAPALSTWIITWDGHKYSRKFNFPSWRPMIYRWRYKRMDIIYCRHFVFPATARYFERVKFHVYKSTFEHEKSPERASEIFIRVALIDFIISAFILLIFQWLL